MDCPSGEIFKTQLKQRLAGNVLDINNSMGSFHGKASVFFSKGIAGTPSQILSSISLLFFHILQNVSKQKKKS